MSIEDSKSLYRHYVKVLAHPDRLDEVIAPDFVAHDLPPGSPQGIDGIRAYRRAVMAAFPDQTAEIQDLIAERDRVSARLVLRCTHTGEFAGMKATGRKLEAEVYEIVRIENGKVAERWCLLDRASLMQQLS
jgi:predicted ester cyclase